MSAQQAIPAVWMRGGTSKGLMVDERCLPADIEHRDQLILAAFGSPDPLQVNGIGGARSVFSKVILVRPSDSPDIDVEYEKGQVSIDKSFVSYSNNCGNMTSAVGPYAIDEGWVPVTEPVTTVRMFNRNTHKVVLAEVPVVAGSAAVDGDHAIAGVPGTGAMVRNTYLDPGGAWTGATFPSGNRRDRVSVAGVGELEVTLIDLGNPTILVRASEIGMHGTELPDQIDSDREMLGHLEAVRLFGADRFGITEYSKRQRTPLVVALSPPSDYRTSDGAIIRSDQVDLVARVTTMQRTHPAFSATGLISTASAAAVPGTVASEVASTAFPSGAVRIGHPRGVVEVGVELRDDVRGPDPVAATRVTRTARRLMAGEVYVPASLAADMTMGSPC